MRTGPPTAWVVLLAIPIATILSSCAGAQKPPAPVAEAAVEAAPPAEAAAPTPAPVSPSALASPAAPLVADGAPPAPSPPRPRVSPEVEKLARATFEQAVRLLEMGDLEGAAAAFESARGSGADLPWAGFNAGVLQERLGSPQRAAASYQATLDAFPGFAPAGQNLVRLWLRQGRPLDQVEAELKERLGRADGVALRVGLAEVLLAAGNNAAAEEECKKALKADEKSIPAMVALANSYAGKKRFELARMVLQNARQLDEHDPAVWNRLGFVELALGNRPQAIENFKTAASLRPDYPEAHANYGAVLADTDDFAGAARELELAVKYAPRSAGTWLGLGNAFRGLQEFEKAEAAYRKALELDPAMNEARFNLALLYLDVASPGLPALQRLEQGLAWFDEFEKQGGKEPRVEPYRKDTAREIDREKKRLVRQEKDRLLKETEAKKMAEQEARRLEEERRAAAAAAPPPTPEPAPSPAVTPGPAPAQDGASPATAVPAGSKLKEGGDK